MKTGIAPRYSQFCERERMLIDSQMIVQAVNSVNPSAQRVWRSYRQ